ncbi:MAG: hypothetical protein EA409_00165 [Saprospirales bacterium]|nr:MAG: hypothetical protein EA409_00165 [Saprospirales bacterium]
MWNHLRGEEKMTNECIMKIIDYEVAPCPRCNEAHSFKLKGLAQRKAQEEVPIFGGTGATEETGRKSEILLTCPKTKKNFSYAVSEPTGLTIIGLASEVDIALATNTVPASSPIESDFEEWTKKSRDIALDFCKTMLSTSTGSIPIYFAILKYIGFEKIGSTILSKFAVLPPILFLAAAIFYLFGLRPQYESVAPQTFNAFRKRRLKKLNRFITWGTAIFIGALGLTIWILFCVLSQ